MVPQPGLGEGEGVVHELEALLESSTSGASDTRHPSTYRPQGPWFLLGRGPSKEKFNREENLHEFPRLKRKIVRDTGLWLGECDIIQGQS